MRKKAGGDLAREEEEDDDDSRIFLSIFSLKNKRKNNKQYSLFFKLINQYYLGGGTWKSTASD